MFDDDPPLGLQLLDERHDLLQRRHAVLVAVDEKAGRGAGREERKIEAIGRRRDRDESFDLGPPHQELHADPRAEGDAGDPAGPRFGIDGLRPIEGGCRIR